MLRGKDMKKNWNHDPKLVGGFKHGFYFPFHIWDVILPIDSYFSRWLKTTKQMFNVFPDSSNAPVTVPIEPG